LRRAAGRSAVLLAIGVALIAGCARGLNNSPERWETIASEIVDLAAAPKYADVELTGMSIEKEYLLVGLGDEAPEFVGDVLSRYGMVVNFTKRRVGVPVDCFDRHAVAANLEDCLYGTTEEID
jgi:hypothetical protein